MPKTNKEYGSILEFTTFYGGDCRVVFLASMWRHSLPGAGFLLLAKEVDARGNEEWQPEPTDDVGMLYTLRDILLSIMLDSNAVNARVLPLTKEEYDKLKAFPNSAWVEERDYYDE